jgi:5-methylcytosine-specific restriction endonuclease McrA
MSPRSPIRQVSPRQRTRESNLQKIKRTKIKEQVEERGYAWCTVEGCFRTFSQETARHSLDLDHIRSRSLEPNPEVADRPENLRLVCQPCHRLKHHQ